MTLTGRQIREARALLGLTPGDLAKKVRMIATGTVTRAESVDDEPPITMAQAAAIRSFLECAGVEFGAGVGDESGVRLRKTVP